MQSCLFCLYCCFVNSNEFYPLSWEGKKVKLFKLTYKKNIYNIDNIFTIKIRIQRKQNHKEKLKQYTIYNNRRECKSPWRAKAVLQLYDVFFFTTFWCQPFIKNDNFSFFLICVPYDLEALLKVYFMIIFTYSLQTFLFHMTEGFFSTNCKIFNLYKC